MYSKTTLFHRPLVLISILIFFGSASAQTGIDPPGVIRPGHLSELKLLKEKAQNKAQQNLNRYALEDLAYYDQLLDSMSSIEILDSINILEQEYKRSTGSRIEELEKNRSLIQELTDAKAKNDKRYNGLLRKAGIAFGAWFLIVLVLLQLRKRHLRKQTHLLSENTTKLEAMIVREQRGKKYIHANNRILGHSEKIFKATTTLSEKIKNPAYVNSIADEKKSLLEEINNQVEQLHQLTDSQLKVSQFVQSLEKQPASDLVQTDINSMCETALEIAHQGASFHIPKEFLLVSKDLEKNLPKIPLVPEAIHALLLNILNNAFQAVKIKYDEGVKGYQPKVVLSTRILPRFLQIRIRDNGDGIPKEQLEKVLDEFHALRPLESGAGLGLPDSLQILGEPHKGEMRIESDTTEGTNVYIKFFL
jgi:signal transduction histidine kinase